MGAGIAASGVPRQDIFLTSKLWNTHHAPADVEEAVDESLADLRTDYLDLYLIHWPISFAKPPADTPRLRAPLDPADGGVHVTNVPLEDTWKALEDVVAKGKIRSIGVSNFTQQQLEGILKV